MQIESYGERKDSPSDEVKECLISCVRFGLFFRIIGFRWQGKIMITTCQTEQHTGDSQRHERPQLKFHNVRRDSPLRPVSQQEAAASWGEKQSRCVFTGRLTPRDRNGFDRCSPMAIITAGRLGARRSAQHFVHGKPAEIFAPALHALLGIQMKAVVFEKKPGRKTGVGKNSRAALGT
jgi:hypothetical protein